MLEIWHEWQPLKKMMGDYYIESYSNVNLSVLKIILATAVTPKDMKIHISAVGADAYYLTNKKYPFKRWEFLATTNKNLNWQWPLFQVDNSLYLNLLSEESGGISEHRELKHYCVMDNKWVFDIAYDEDPYCEFFINGKLVETAGRFVPNDD